MRSIIIVSSEMQLYNAIEAIEHFKSSHNTLLVSNYTSRNKRILNQLDIPQVSSKFDRIHVMNTFDHQGRFYYFIFNLLAIFRILILSLFNRYDYVMTGNYTDAMHRYLASSFVRHSKVVILDDGNLTYSIVDARKEETKTGYASFSNAGNRITRLLRFLMKDSAIIESVTYFTVFELKADTQHEEVHKNRYEYIKAKGSSLFNFPISRDAVYIVGSPFAEIGMMSANDYRSILLKIENIFKGLVIEYIQHPSEKGDCLPVDDNFHTLQLEVPCELLAASLPQGTIFMGFCSSAIQNAQIIRPDLDVRYIDIRPYFPASKPIIDSQIDVWKAIDDTYQSMSKSISEQKILSS